MVHLVDGCGKLYGFASGHASNSFALATFLVFSLRTTFKPMIWMLVWAGLVTYSRIYVGEHYPGDVIVGALIGSILAFVLFYAFKKVSPYLPESLNLSSRP